MVDAFAVARDILPVGSVVRLEGADALVMVMGFEPNLDGDEIADYLGAPYPMGLISEDTALAFDSSAVAEVCHRGFWDDEAERGVAAVRRFHAATTDAYNRLRELADSLTPERYYELRDYYTFDMGEDEPEPDFLDELDLPDEPEPDLLDGEGGLS